jgi:hypothetical protein
MASESAFYDSVNGRVSVTTTGIKLSFCPSRPIKVVRVSFCPVSALTASGTLTFAARVRPLPGSASGETVYGPWTFVVPASGVNGYVGYDLLFDLARPALVYPGSQIAIDVTAALAAGTCDLFIDYQALPLEKDDFATPYASKLIDYSA